MLWLKKRYGRSRLRLDSPCGLELIAIVGVMLGGVVPPGLSKHREATPDRGLAFLDVLD